MSERSQVTDKIIKWAEKTPGIYAVKVHCDQMQGAGIPDILACVNGKFVAVEAKRPSGGRLSKLQEHELKKIVKAGGVGAVCRSLEEFMEIVRGVE